MSLHVPNLPYLKSPKYRNFPAFLQKTQTSSLTLCEKKAEEIGFVRDFLIEKYSKTNGSEKKSKSFLVKKAVENIVFNSLPKEKLHKISSSLYKDQKKLAEQQSENVIKQEKEKIEDVDKLNLEKLKISAPIEPPKRKKQNFLSGLIPGYQTRKEYYDFDEISLEESSSPSVKSVYRLRGTRDEWSSIIQHDVNKYHEQIKNKKYLMRQEQNRLKTELDEQVKRKKEVKELEKLEENKYHQSLLAQVNRLDEIERQKVTQAVRNRIVAKEGLDKQQEDFLKVKRIEKKIDKKYKEILTSKIQKEIEEENRKLFLQRQRNLQRNQEMMRESIENRQKMQLMETKEKEQDVKMQEAYMKDFENMLNEREIQKRQRLEEIQKKYGIASNVLKSFDRQAIDKEDQLQLKYYKIKEEEEKKELERKKAKMLENREIIKDSLLKQIKEKEMVRERENTENKQQAEFWNRNTMEFFREENEKKKKEKLRQIEYVEGLKTQANLKAILLAPQKKMNDEELLQNKDLLKHLVTKSENEPVMREFVRRKKKIY